MGSRSARALAASLIVLGAACGGGTPAGLLPSAETPPVGGGCAFDGRTARDYEGTAQVDVTYRDVFGNAYERSFALADAGVEVQAPLQDEGLTESNPVHLTFGTVGQSSEGSFIGNSAVPYVDPDDGRPLLLEYWSLAASCERISGTLADSHQREGLGLANAIQGQKNLGAGLGYTSWSFVMGTGASLEGEGDAAAVRLTVRGEDFEGILNFTISITARAEP